mgnify:FL=1
MKRKLIALMMSALTVTLMLTGCGGGKDEQPSQGAAEETAADTQTDTTGAADEGTPADAGEEMYQAVLVYIVGQDSQEQDLVSERFNELTREQLNMEVTLMPMTFSTWGSQLPMMLAGGEQVDLFPMFSTSVPTYMESEYLVDLSPYMDKIPYIIETVGEDGVNCCSINGFLYGIPVMKERTTPAGLIVRTDCLEAAGIDPQEIKSYDDMTAVYEKVQALYPDMTMFGGSANGTSVASPGGQTVCFDGLGDILGMAALEDYGQTTTVTNYYESEDFRHKAELAREWYLAGYIAKDMATCTDGGETLMKAGNLFSYLTACKPNTKQEKDDQTGYDVTVIQMDKPLVTSVAMNGITYGVGSGSKDPAKAMELINWIYETKEANDLLNWGVEGVHWVEQEDGTANFPEGVTMQSCGYHQNMGFILPNQFNSHVWAGNDSDIFEQYAQVDESAIRSLGFGCTTDLRSVTNQLAAVNDVVSQYLAPITTGAIDPDTAIDEFNQALYDAGLQDIIDLKQEQIDQWLAEQN